MTRAEFIAILEPLAQAMRTEIDVPTWTVYYRALQDVSPALLEAVVNRLIREPREFFPKAGELRGECDNQRARIVAAHPYDGCAQCEEHGKGWQPVLVNGVQRMVRCGCYGRHLERLALLGVSDAPALPAPRDMTVDAVPAGVRQQLLEAIRDKVMR